MVPIRAIQKNISSTVRAVRRTLTLGMSTPSAVGRRSGALRLVSARINTGVSPYFQGFVLKPPSTVGHVSELKVALSTNQ